MRNTAPPTICSLAIAGLLILGGCGNDDDPVGPEHGSISGFVEDQDGQGVDGVTIEISRADNEHTATTDGGGSFSFSQIATGGWTLEATPPDGFDLDPAQTMPLPVQVEAGQTTDVTILLLADDDPGNGDDDDPDTVEVLARGSSFDPSDVTITPGTTVQWTNEMNVSHTVTPVDHSEWNEANLSSADQTFSHTFQSEGEFPYLCTLHQGMTGIIRVEED